jgi:hypothetical protein
MLIRRLNLPAASAPDAAVLDQRVARVAGLATLTAIFAGVVYSCELGFGIYAVPFAIPHAVFAGARSSRKWQAWGWAIAWVTIGLALVPTILTTFRTMRRAHHSEVAVLVFLMALLLTQTAQLIFVRRAFPGKIAFGSAVLRCTLYLCLLDDCSGRDFAELVCSADCAPRKQSNGQPTQILHRDGIVCDDVEGRQLSA